MSMLLFFLDNNWLVTLAYMAVILSKLNELNLSLQGPAITVFKAYDKVKSFQEKINLWLRYVKSNDFSPFKTLDSFLSENDMSLPSDFCDCRASHLCALNNEIESYFSENYSESKWIRDPFLNSDFESSNLPVKLREQLCEIRCDSGMKTQFLHSDVNTFRYQQAANILNFPMRH